MAHPLDFPALEGRPVTQAHTDRCAAIGHAAHTVDGAATGNCPRCGECTEPPALSIAIVNANDVDREIWIDGTIRIPLPAGFKTWHTSAVLAEHGYSTAGHLKMVGPGQFSIQVRREPTSVPVGGRITWSIQAFAAIRAHATYRVIGEGRHGVCALLANAEGDQGAVVELVEHEREVANLVANYAHYTSRYCQVHPIQITG